MRHGLYFPPFDALADPVLLADLARGAEQAGWDGIFVWDHLLFSPPVSRILDPWICLAAMAAATERIQLGPMVTPLARRRPQIVARQAVTLDHLSRGRLVLGFGLGDDGRTGELSRFGEETDARLRADLLDDGLDALTGLFSGRSVTRPTDTLHHLDGVRFEPGPWNDGGIPMWIAARWPNRRPIRRAARYHGVFAIELERPDDVVALRGLVEEAGADLATFDIVCAGRRTDDPSPWEAAGATWWMTQLGPFDMDVHDIRRMIAAGPRR